MRIGILPALVPSSGGIYQYSLTILHVLNQWKSDGCEDHFVLFTDEITHPAVATGTNGDGWIIKPLQRPSQVLNMLRRIIGEGPHREMWRWLRLQMSQHPILRKPALPDPDVVRYEVEANRWFNNCGVDLMIYPAPTPLSFEAGVPYVMAIHDLQHRLQPEFPEVSANGEWERREYRYRNGARCATLLLADSEVGKEDILNFYGPYGVTPDQVKVLPYLPACYLATDVSQSERQRVRAIYRLPERYLFYPAQFWPHKNHIRIVQALGLLKQKHKLDIPAVFCGSYTGEIRERIMRDVMSLSSQLGLEKQIHYLGYVPDQDMSGIYAEAVALVMPTFFGPTNIPILEAWAFGCPVLTSDIRGVREQAQDAAVLVDPRSIEAIADGIYRLWTDENLACRLANLGRQRLGSYTPDDYYRRLIEILEEAKARVYSQKSNSAKSWHVHGLERIDGTC
jgi:glycosyltransferase involved in cell wall biosynthesis